MPEAEYYAQLEKLMLELARVYEPGPAPPSPGAGAASAPDARRRRDRPADEVRGGARRCRPRAQSEQSAARRNAAPRRSNRTHQARPAVDVDAPADFSDVAPRPQNLKPAEKLMPGDAPVVRDFIYLDYSRVTSLAAQLGVSEDRGAARPLPPGVRTWRRGSGRSSALEAAVVGRGATQIDATVRRRLVDPPTPSPTGSSSSPDGVVRLLDFSWLAMALTGLPAVLKKMSKIEMAALKNSDEGRRLSKSAHAAAQAGEPWPPSPRSRS